MEKKEDDTKDMKELTKEGMGNELNVQLKLKYGETLCLPRIVKTIFDQIPGKRCCEGCGERGCVRCHGVKHKSRSLHTTI